MILVAHRILHSFFELIWLGGLVALVWFIVELVVVASRGRYQRGWRNRRR